MKFTVVVVLILCYAAYLNAETTVERCPNGNSTLSNQTITIGNCKISPCKLKRKSVVMVEFRFTSDRNVENITNMVKGIVVGLPLPFIGVDNTDACHQIFESDGTTKAGCPLHARKEYVYKNQFEVKDIYPKLNLDVHWALTADDGKDVMCFQIPAQITN